MYSVQVFAGHAARVDVRYEQLAIFTSCFMVAECGTLLSVAAAADKENASESDVLPER